MNVPLPPESDAELTAFLRRPKGTLPPVDEEKLQRNMLIFMRALARHKNLSVKAWAEKSQRAEQTLRDILNGDTPNLPLTTARLLAKALDCRLFEVERFMTYRMLLGQV